METVSQDTKPISIGVYVIFGYVWAEGCVFGVGKSDPFVEMYARMRIYKRVVYVT